ncbi:MAG: pimeloyl-CoA dehydrogenase small subunit [Alphaproteobacteria bacterium]|nr:pimeloyl-CoA dehydrogenase small subunit [Alphaproteobacteria bacterium]
MDIALSEEQQLLKDSAERFIERDYSFDRRRQLVATEDGFSRDNWRRFAELGWLGLALPADHGGLDGSLVDTAVLMEALGRGLVVEPFLSSVLLAGGLLRHGGNADQQAALIPPLIKGGSLFAFAFTERQSRYNLADVETTARANGDGYVLNGAKGVVMRGASADKLIVSARVSGDSRDRAGISLFLVDGDAAGVSRRGYPTIDGLHGAEVALEGVAVSGDALLGPAGGAFPLIERVIDEASVAICAEAVGVMAVLVDATVDYLKTREQFGSPIGSFQVLQHRAVDMFNALELSRALVYRAAETIAASDDAANRARAASAAKVQIGRAGRLIGQQAIQLHGGMGMTDELSVSHYFKRLTMIGTLFGDADYHLKRYTALGNG